jgi:hypothetical protein
MTACVMLHCSRGSRASYVPIPTGDKRSSVLIVLVMPLGVSLYSSMQATVSS